MADEDYITVAEAQELLGVGTKKMAKLLALGKQGQPDGLAWVPDPLDGRIKRVRRADVETLRRQSAKKAA